MKEAWTKLRNWFRPKLRQCTCGGTIHWHQEKFCAVCDRCFLDVNSSVQHWTDAQVNEARQARWLS